MNILLHVPCDDIACEYSRLSFAPATTTVSHVVARANERRLYSQASDDNAARDLETEQNYSMLVENEPHFLYYFKIA